MHSISLSQKILDFHFSLDPDFDLPAGIELMNPFKNREVRQIASKFYHQFYNDHNPRILILGINPGRFGGGITGIPFTDPIRLTEVCKIENFLIKKQELSAVFVYEVINNFGGASKFYSHFYINSVCPLGFTKNGNNLNYYDDKTLLLNVKSFCVESIKKQIGFGLKKSHCICFGEGKNYDYLMKVNDEFNFFNKIHPLPHPRYIMQYKSKEIQKYMELYLSTFYIID